MHARVAFLMEVHIGRASLGKERGSVSCLNCHLNLNQAVHGCGDGNVDAMFYAEAGSVGVLTCVEKERRMTAHASCVGPICLLQFLYSYKGVNYSQKVIHTVRLPLHAF